MRVLLAVILLLQLYHPMAGQSYQGLIVPDNKGRFSSTGEITQASGLALDPNGTSFWTHNDQGNPTTKVYKFLPTTGNTNVTVQKEVTILNTTNLDWEDLAKDNTGNIYLSQVGKNCNANSDPNECPNRFIFKIHKLSLASLNHPDSMSVTPETYYFKYPLTGYDIINCDGDDTVFVNCEAVIWHNDALYLFTKNIWSKYTNNCGGWIEGYTNYFKLELNTSSSMQNPLVAVYKGKVNLKVYASDASDKYQVTAAAISPDQSILALVSYGRIWQFRNFTGDQFFNGTKVFSNYSLTGTDSITRAFEGIEFSNNQYITLCVDNLNGRVSGINLDSIALWVRNTNDSGPGSLRNALLSASEGDTLRFKSSLINDTIILTSGPLIFNRNIHISQPNGQSVFVQASTTNVITIPNGKNISLKNLNILCGNAVNGGIINQGTLLMENVTIKNNFPFSTAVRNLGNLIIKGTCNFRTN